MWEKSTSVNSYDYGTHICFFICILADLTEKCNYIGNTILYLYDWLWVLLFCSVIWCDHVGKIVILLKVMKAWYTNKRKTIIDIIIIISYYNDRCWALYETTILNTSTWTATKQTITTWYSNMRAIDLQTTYPVIEQR